MRKKVLVTGGVRGLGKEVSKIFAENNYDVIINYKASDDLAKELQKEIENTYNVKVYLYKCDVANEDAVKEMFLDIEKNIGKIDIIVNNAGIANDSEFLKKTKEDFISVYETNLVGPFLCCKYASKMLNENASIINVSSTNGLNTYYSYSADYDASKAALINLSKNLATELAPIRVNVVAPGWINTDMNKELDEDYIAEECEGILLKRFAEPVEVAKVIYFLASDDASYINNTVIVVDGGLNV